MSKAYLGDGLYVEDEGFQFKLFEDTGMNAVYLDPTTLDAFFRYIEKTRHVEITVKEASHD